MASAAEASLEERVQRVVEAAVAARRDELEQLVRDRVDVALIDLATELVDAQLAKRCSNCGGTPVLPNRTICRPCLRARSRELHAARVARRRSGSAAGADDEDPEPAPACDEPEQASAPASGSANGRGRARERVGGAESRVEPAAGVSGWREPEQVEERSTGIAVDELARRAGGPGVLALRADDLEAWLREAGLARVTGAGRLVPTDRAVEIAGALGPP